MVSDKYDKNGHQFINHTEKRSNKLSIIIWYISKIFDICLILNHMICYDFYDRLLICVIEFRLLHVLKNCMEFLLQ